MYVNINVFNVFTFMIPTMFHVYYNNKTYLLIITIFTYNDYNIQYIFYMHYIKYMFNIYTSNPPIYFTQI